MGNSILRSTLARILFRLQILNSQKQSHRDLLAKALTVSDCVVHTSQLYLLQATKQHHQALEDISKKKTSVKS